MAFCDPRSIWRRSGWPWCVGFICWSRSWDVSGYFPATRESTGRCAVRSWGSGPAWSRRSTPWRCSSWGPSWCPWACCTSPRGPCTFTLPSRGPCPCSCWPGGVPRWSPNRCRWLTSERPPGAHHGASCSHSWCSSGRPPGSTGRTSPGATRCGPPPVRSSCSSTPAASRSSYSNCCSSTAAPTPTGTSTQT